MKASVISWLLIVVMLIGALASCKGEKNESTSSSSETTEPKAIADDENNSAIESGSVSESETQDTEQIPGGPYDTTPLTLTTPEVAFPDYKEYENVFSTNVTPFELKVEGESFTESTIPWNKLSGSEFSGGVMMRVIHGENHAPSGGWDTVYAASYKIKVPEAGSYSLTVLTTDLSKDYTSDYYIDVNGERAYGAASTGTILERFPSPTQGDNGLFKIIALGNITLKQGENVITFTIDNVDSQASRGRLCFCLDYFTVKRSGYDLSVMDVTADVDANTLENGNLIAGAADVNVFDRRLPLKLTISHVFESEGTVSYTVTDFFGNAIYEGKLSGKVNDLVTVERGVKNHPTGYFTLTCGDNSVNYVVTPSYETRTLETSPFAMDYAASMHNSNLTNCYNVTAAARLAGVTWVRDRASWTSYEPSKGKYNFTSTENIFKTIDSTGMKILVDLCPAPSWATAPAGYTGPGRVGGFQHNQLAFYNMCKAMVEYYDGVVDAWELWNESDHGFAVETSELFSAWYKAGALGAIDADPNMIVSFGGFCIPNTNTDYVHLTMLNDILKYSSIYNYHSHIAQPSNYSFIDFNKTAMQRYAYPTAMLYNLEERPVWLTEAGMRVDNMIPKSYIKQAPYIVTSTVQSLSVGTDMHYWFLLAPYKESGGDFGTFSPALEPYPTLAAEATMTEVLGEAKYLGTLSDLPRKGYGYVFSTGSRMASVVWSESSSPNYTFKATAPVIVTDLMGGKALLEPVDGEITVKLSTNPIFITYSNPLSTFCYQEFDDSKLAPLTFTLGDRVVLSPEFENYNINDATIKKDGHVVSDGLKIKVRVTNYNDVEVKGKITATLTGFEVLGCDTEITVKPYSEEFVTLTLKKTGDEGINTYITFTGNFNGEETSAAVAHVYTKGTADTGKISFVSLKEGGVPADKLSSIKATVEGCGEGKPFVLLNEAPFEKYTYENGTIDIDLSDIGIGRYILVVAFEKDSGDYVFAHLTFSHNGEKITIALP